MMPGTSNNSSLHRPDGRGWQVLTQAEALALLFFERYPDDMVTRLHGTSLLVT